MKKLFPLFFIALFAISCSSNQHLAVKPGIAIDTLHIQVNYPNSIHEDLKAECEKGFDNALIRFNKRYGIRFFTAEVQEASQADLIFNIDSAGVASKASQSTAAAVTVLGLALPVVMVVAEVPLIVFFWMNSKNDLYIMEQLREDWKRNAKIPDRRFNHFSTGGWGRSPEKNRIRSGKHFENVIYNKLSAINNTVRP